MYDAGKRRVDQSVFAATMAENESSCSPPLTEQEVRIIVSSATKYDKGKPIHIDSEGVATRENKDDVIGNRNGFLAFLIVTMIKMGI